MTKCWCGSTEFLPFSPEYAECNTCGTLVSLVGMSPEELTVSDDETDFYGKAYWLGHQSEDLGFPDIYRRARADLTERNLHWLKVLLKYRLPGAKVMELGCSHGSFVALLRHAGYDAFGVEMSPWVVDFGKTTFNIPVFVGPVENLDIPDGSLDVVALMDVMEHLPDPAATLAHCLRLLKPDGLLLIQTPQFKREMKYAELLETNGAFLEQLKSDEHLFLFTEDSARRLFQQIGAEYMQFEPAIFSHYDMFFAVSRVPLRTCTPQEIDTALAAVPNGRMTTALLELRERELASESDRIARGEQIETLTRMVKESEADRAARGAQIETLSRMLKEGTDQFARDEQVETLSRMLKESEADRTARSERMEILARMLKEFEVDRVEGGEQIRQLAEWLVASETERKIQAEKIIALTGSIEQSKAETLVRNEEIYTLVSDLRVLFSHRAFRLLAKIARWREAEKLENRIKQS